MNAQSQLDLNRSQRRTLELIRRRGPISRTELTEEANLTAGAISRVCRELLLMGLVEEQDRRAGARGQPAVPLVISGEGGISIGISISFRRVEIVAMDYAGTIRARAARPLPREETPLLLEALDAATAELRADFSDAPARLVGVGLATSGAPTQDGTHMAAIPDFMTWLDIDALRAWSLDTWGSSLLIGNNARMAALSEFYAANDPGLRYLVGINIGYGFGSGVIQDGTIFGGLEGRAGGVGALFPKTLPRPTTRDLMVSLQSCGRDVVVVEDLDRFRAEDDPVVAAWIERVAGQLGPLVSTVWLLLGPEEIILTGHLPRHVAKDIAARLTHGLETWPTGTAMPVPRILPARLGRLSIAAGAAWLPILREGSTTDMKSTLDQRVHGAPHGDRIPVIKL